MRVTVTCSCVATASSTRAEKCAFAAAKLIVFMTKIIIQTLILVK